MFRPILFECLKQGYSFSFFKRDVLSGLTVAVVAIPLSIAFAIASGATPTIGLFTAIIGGFIVSFLGGSKYNISGPAGAFIGVIFGVIAHYGYNGLLISNFMAGIFLILFAIFKLGKFVKKIPNVVITGFSLGLGLDIFSGQVPDFFGFKYYGSHAFLTRWHSYFELFKNIHFTSFAIGSLTLITAMILKIKKPKWPAFLIAIIISTIISQLLSLNIETLYSRFGAINLTLPEFHHSILDEIEHPTHLFQYIIPALTIAFLAGIEALLSATIADKIASSKHKSNTELFGQGIANLVLPLFGCLPVAGTTARTIVNVNSGAKSPISGMLHSVFILVFLAIFAKLIVKINMPTIAGILFIVAINMMSVKKIISILKHNIWIEKIIVLSTAICVITNGIVVAIFANSIAYYILLKLNNKRFSRKQLNIQTKDNNIK